jgi:hypothetical protein
MRYTGADEQYLCLAADHGRYRDEAASATPAESGTKCVSAAPAIA